MIPYCLCKLDITEKNSTHKSFRGRAIKNEDIKRENVAIPPPFPKHARPLQAQLQIVKTNLDITEFPKDQKVRDTLTGIEGGHKNSTHSFKKKEKRGVNTTKQTNY